MTRKSESFSVLARAGLKGGARIPMLAFPKMATAPARHGVDAAHIVSIEDVVRKPMDQRKRAAG